MKCAEPAERELDLESADWLHRLPARDGVWRQEAGGDPHARLPRIALAARPGLQRNAMYEVIFGARRKIRRPLVAKGHLEDPGLEQR